MTDTPPSPEPAPDHELAVDLAAFLPEGTTLGDDEGATSGDAWPDEAAGTWPDAAAEADAAEPEAEPEPAADPGPTGEAEGPKAPPVDLAALGQVEADLGAVDAALLALDQGRYGRCAACDQPIDDDLLAADPVRTTCPAHTAA